MKKYLRIILLVLVVGFLTTGCMEENISMVINNDKSMDFSMYVSLDLKAMQDLTNSFGGSNDEMTEEEYLNCIDENDGDETNCIAPGSSSSDFDIDDLKDSINQDAVKEFEEEGFTVTQNITSDKLELNLSKKFDNIDDVSSNEDVIFNVNENFDKFFKMEKGFLDNKYTLHMVNDSQNIDNNDSDIKLDTENFDLSTLSNMIDMTFQITLPNESISNNATSISNDKKTLTWDLVTNENKEISVTFALPNENKNLIIYGGIGLGVLLILIILIIVISKNKKKKVNNTPNVNQNVMPNQQVNNQNVGGQSMNNVPISMPSNGAVSLSSAPIPNETVVPIVGQQVMPSTIEQPITTEIPVEAQPIIPQAMEQPISKEAPVEVQPVIPPAIEQPITTEKPVEVQPIIPPAMEQPIAKEAPVEAQPIIPPAIEQPIAKEAPVEAQPVIPPAIEQTITTEIPVEAQPVISPAIEQPIAKEAPVEEQHLDMENSSSTSANEINKINADLQNVALNILNHNNEK